MAKKSLINKYAEAMVALKTAEAFIKENKAEVVGILKQTKDKAADTPSGTLHYTSKSGARELDNGILDVIPAAIIREVVKAQVGLIDKAVKEKKLDQKLVDKYITTKESVDIVTIS
jgi:hypothetical protein